MNLFANGFSLDVALEMIRRRLWTAISLFSVVVMTIAGMAMALPDLYTARAFILVEGQQIPQDYVRSTVTMPLERRLQIISQEILSRPRLGRLAEQFGLSEDLREQGAAEDVVAAAIRQDIGVQIKGRGAGMGNDTVVFEVSYTNPDPGKVAKVANTLASFYIEENMKVREQQALGTSEFLRAELKEVENRLEAQEQQVVEYKTRHMGELPEQLNANLATLGVLQKQLEVVSDNLARARERRNVLVQMAEMESALASLGTETPKGDTGDARLGALKSQLAELKIRFLDKHPDVIRIKQQIAALEAEEKKSQEESLPATDPGLPDTSLEAPLDLNMPMAAPGISSSHIEQAAIDAEIASLNAAFVKAQNDIATYKQRIENAPQHEQEMLSLTRDYNVSRELYASMLKRLDEATLSGRLEERQKAERFRLLEPAVDPREPEGPQRLRLLLIGLVLGIGAATAGVVLWEILDTSFHRLEDLKVFSTAPVLISIPRIITDEDQLRQRRRQYIGATALAVSLFILICTSYWVAAGNHQLVRLFVRPTSGSQVR